MKESSERNFSLFQKTSLARRVPRRRSTSFFPWNRCPASKTFLVLFRGNCIRSFSCGFPLHGNKDRTQSAAHDERDQDPYGCSRQRNSSVAHERRDARSHIASAGNTESILRPLIQVSQPIRRYNHRARQCRKKGGRFEEILIRSGDSAPGNPECKVERRNHQWPLQYAFHRLPQCAPANVSIAP